jgi:hypothetical protein
MIKSVKSILPWLCLLFETISLIAIVFIRMQDISPDFKVFYLQSERLVTGERVFDFNDYVAYNSTFLYLLISPLTLLDLTNASKVFLIVNALLLPIITYLLVRLLGGSNFLEKFIVIFAILQISFYVRSILNNGQVGIIMLLFLLLAILSLLKKNHNEWLVAGTLWLAFELKPYLIIPLLIWLYWLLRNNRLLLKFISIGMSFQCLYFTLNPSTNIFIYIKLVLSRVGSVSSEFDQSSLSAVLHGIFGFPKSISYLIHLILAILIIRRISSRLKKVDLVSFALVLNFSSFINVYLHRQDPIITILIFLLLWQQIKEIESKNLDLILFSLILVLLSNWGNKSFPLAIAMDLLLVVILVFTNLGTRISLIILTLSLLQQYIQVYTLSNYGWTASYELWRTLILMYTLSCCLVLPRLQDK